MKRALRTLIAVAILALLALPAVSQFNGCPPGFCGGGGGTFVPRISGILADPYVNFASNQAYQNGNVTTPAAVVSVTRAAFSAGTGSGFQVNSAGVWSNFAANTLRRSDRGVRIEEARTNGQLWSQDLSNAAYSNGGLNAVTFGPGPDGSATSASFMQEDTNNVTHRSIGNTVAGNSTQTWTISGFYKPNGRAWVRLQLSDGGANNVAVWFNCSGAGAVGSTSVAGTSVSVAKAIVMFPNGWCWVSSTVTPSSVNSTAVQGLWGLSSADAITSYVGDGISGGYWWNTQVELGASATSPIPTTTGAVARSTDAIMLTGAPAFGSSYTIYARAAPDTSSAFIADQFLLCVSDGSASNRFIIKRTSFTGTAAAVSVSGGAGPTMTSAIWSQSSSGKEASANAASDQAFSFNGGTVVTGSGALPVAANAVAIGSNQNNGGGFLNGELLEVAIWNNLRAPNTELQRITSMILFMGLALPPRRRRFDACNDNLEGRQDEAA